MTEERLVELAKEIVDLRDCFPGAARDRIGDRPTSPALHETYRALDAAYRHVTFALGELVMAERLPRRELPSDEIPGPV